jgi:hypothetical protein
MYLAKIKSHGFLTIVLVAAAILAIGNAGSPTLKSVQVTNTPPPILLIAKTYHAKHHHHPTPGPTPTPSPTPTPTPSPTSSSTSQPLGIAGNWNLRLDSEFAHGLTTPWAVGWFGTGITGPVNSNETVKYDPANVTTGPDGLHLALTAHDGSLVQTNPSDRGGFAYTYGVAEARICLPGTNGQLANWPAFWSDGQSWPTDGEDDIMEGLGGAAAYHFHSPSGGPGADVAGNFTGCHTYASDWGPGHVTYYYDGVKVGSITQGITSAPMYLILDFTTAGVVAPSVMVVQYVKVWQ